MINANESGVRHQIVSLGAAIIGMGAPSDIGQKARGVSQTLVFLVLLEMG